MVLSEMSVSYQKVLFMLFREWNVDKVELSHSRQNGLNGNKKKMNNNITRKNNAHTIKSTFFGCTRGKMKTKW